MAMRTPQDAQKSRPSVLRLWHPEHSIPDPAFEVPNPAREAATISPYGRRGKLRCQKSREMNSLTVDRRVRVSRKQAAGRTMAKTAHPAAEDAAISPYTK